MDRGLVRLFPITVALAFQLLSLPEQASAQDTPTATPTVPDTETPAATETPTDTETPAATETPTDTETPVATETETAASTNTPTEVETATSLATATSTAVSTVTETPEFTTTPTVPDTPTATSTETATPSATETPAEGCVRSQGFWKTHPEEWPVDTLTLGSQTYSQAELLALLSMPVRGDATLILAKQLIAAKLNIADGADGSAIADTIEDADALLAQFTGKLPYGIRPSTDEGHEAVHLAGTLGEFNEGELEGGPDSCDDDEDEETPTGTPTATGTPATFTPTVTGTPATSTPTPKEGCVAGQGFWKNHAELWPVDSLTLGAQDYTQQELLILLHTPIRGDASLILAKQLIAAELSIASGADDAAVADAIAQAHELLSEFEGKLPFGFSPSSSAGQTAVHLAGELDRFSKGETNGGPSHCDDLEAGALTIDQWMARPTAWTLQSLKLGDQNYSRDELLSLLPGTRSAEDASLILARELVAAKLNIARGTDAGVIADTLRAAATWLSGHRGRLPYRVKPKSADGKVAVGLAEPLRQYNTGMLLGGPPRGLLPTIPSLTGLGREVLVFGILLCTVLVGALARRRKQVPSTPR